MLPFLSPQIINARHPFPHLENGGLYIVVRLDEEARPQGEEVEGGARPRQGRGQDQGHEEPRRRGRDAGHHSAAAPDEPCHRAARRRAAVHPGGARHRDVRRRGLLDVHRQAHQHHLRDPQRRFGCHGRRRRAGRGLPRAHEAHPEEAQPPGAGAPGKRAAALAHGEGASAGEVGPGRAPAVRHPRAAEHGLHLGVGQSSRPPRRAPRSPRRRSRLSGPPASIASAPSSSR